MRSLRRFAYYLRSVGTLLAHFGSPASVAGTFLARGRLDPRVVRLRSSGLRFLVRNRMDIWVIKETCIDRDYERCGVPLEDGWNVIDVGAGIGDFSVLAAHASPRGAVHAYEPFPGSFALLQRNIGLNGVANVTAFEEAISGPQTELFLDLSDVAEVRHVTRRVDDTTHPPSGRRLNVSSITLKEAIARLPGSRCHLLKLDCEGAEFDIILASDDASWEAVDRVVGEYHEGPQTGSSSALVAALSDRGFDARRSPNPYRRDVGFIYAEKRSRDARPVALS